MAQLTPPTRVVVIGGGYAGTVAANRMRLRPDVDVTLVNPRPEFVERIRLHQLIAGTSSAVVEYGSMLAEGVRLVVDTATRIDLGDGHVELAAGPPLAFDYVIYAVGSTGALPALVPGAAEHAYPIAELELAQQLRTILEDASGETRLTVVGGGLTGIEVATELAEQGRNVSLICGGELGPYLSEKARRTVAKALRSLGVEVLESQVVTEVTPDAVVLSDGTVRPSGLTIWVAGFGVPDLARTSGLTTDARGRLLTDETLTSVDDPRVVAAGDCASPSGAPLRMSCQNAIPLGMRAADTVLSRLAGIEPQVIDQASLGACISLGRRSGLVQFARRDDTVIDRRLSGRLIAPVKEAVCRSTVWTLRREARRPGSAFWFKGGNREELRRKEAAGAASKDSILTDAASTEVG